MKQHSNLVTLEADIKLIESTEELQQEVASVVKFPENKTPDMLFFSGIFVSSGGNLNHAFFMPSELVKAHATINNKALDIEHEETDIVGHIYSSAFVSRDGTKLDVSSLQDIKESELDKMEIDIMIAGILYKSRFPELATEVKDNEWKLSMETYFQDYDIKIGNLILSKKEAEALGLIVDDVVGKAVKILRRGKEIAKGEVDRVLRGLMFSGCGLVKNPANPRSLILETAKNNMAAEEEIVIELEPDASIKKEKAVDFTSPIDVQGGPNANDIRTQTNPGVCIDYKKRVIDATFEGPDAKILHENWCMLYDTGCTSLDRSAVHPDCIRRVVVEITRDYTKHRLEDVRSGDKRGDLLAHLKSLLGS